MRIPGPVSAVQIVVNRVDALPRRRAGSRRVAAVGVVALGLGLAATGCSSSGSSGSATSEVRITGCTRDAGNHRAVATGQVHNGTSKRSNYVIQLQVKANDSKIESGFASVLRVDSGARKSFTIRAVGADVPSGTTLSCTASHVGRTVSP